MIKLIPKVLVGRIIKNLADVTMYVYSMKQKFILFNKKRGVYRGAHVRALCVYKRVTPSYAFIN